MLPLLNQRGAWGISRIAATGAQARVSVTRNGTTLEAAMTADALPDAGKFLVHQKAFHHGLVHQRTLQKRVQRRNIPLIGQRIGVGARSGYGGGCDFHRRHDFPPGWQRSGSAWGVEARLGAITEISAALFVSDDFAAAFAWVRNEPFLEPDDIKSELRGRFRH